MVVGGLYFVVFAALLGATPGKLLLGLRITRPDGTPIADALAAIDPEEQPARRLAGPLREVD